MVHIHALYFTNVLQVIHLVQQVRHNLYDTHDMCIINKIKSSLIAKAIVVQMDPYGHVQPN